MNRSELIKKFFKSIDAMARIGGAKKHAAHPKHFPPYSQMGVLFVVSHGTSVTIKDVSQRFAMTSSAATQMVNALVKNGFLARKEDTHDRRKICLLLTAKGKKVIEQAKKYRMKKMTEMFEPLTDSELNHLLHIQEKIVAHWETTISQSASPSK
jgi:DNA-binding MarR family transcriptional regulator